MSTELLTWLNERGGNFHPSASFRTGPSGFHIIANELIPAESTVVSCPFDLAITKEVSLRALASLFPSALESLSTWSERQCISTYLCFHHIVDDPSTLQHGPYVRALPSADKLRTGMYFTEEELEAFRGTNMHGAIIDRRAEWHVEWQTCHGVAASTNSAWADRFTWNLYLQAATHLSSRAFPSSLISRTPTLVSSATTEPVLFPGLDMLNHAHSQPVTWFVSFPDVASAITAPSKPAISLLIHRATPAGAELFNNYGPKSNGELILGYGFSLPNNLDDTMLLRFGKTNKWEIGREGKGMWDVYDAFEQTCTDLMRKDEPDIEMYDILLAVADHMEIALKMLLDKIPSSPIGAIRPEVAEMFEHYVEGQKVMLQDALDYTERQRKSALQLARDNGVEYNEYDMSDSDEE